jgi:hypothetical protein
MISNINYFHYGIFNDQVVVGYILASVSDDVDLV